MTPPDADRNALDVPGLDVPDLATTGLDLDAPPVDYVAHRTVPETATELRPAPGADEAAAPEAVRLCVIDMGTNSFHAIVVDARPDATFDVVDRRKEMVLLGEGGFAEGRLTEAAMARGLAALHAIRAMAEAHGATAFVACATSAVREAANGGAFLERVRQETGLVVRTISGATEARLIHLAVSHAVDLTEPSLLIDIGGGSTEFVVADAGGAHFMASLPLGAQRLTERFVSTDPVSRAEFRALRAHVRDQLAGVFAACRAHGVRRVVGSSGTLGSIAQVTAAAYGDPEAPAQGQTFDAGHVREVTKRLMLSTLAERRATPGVKEQRAEQVVAGAIVLDVVLKDLGVERFVVSPDALREGIVLDYLRRELTWIRRLAPYRDLRRRSVYELALRLRFDRAHAEHVAALALQLFDAAAPLHGRGADARCLLEFAALLHDVGYAISRHNHHKHALYIIQEADLPGFRPDERAVMANVARYHRFGTPKPTHAAFHRLPPEDRRLTLELAAFLRLANGLDRSHFRNVARLGVALAPSPEAPAALALTLFPLADAALDVWAARQGADLVEHVFGLPVEIRVAGPAAAPGEVSVGDGPAGSTA